MRFPYDTYVVVLPKGMTRVSAQLHIEGGALAAIHAQGQVLRVWGPGTWHGIEPAQEEE